MQYGIPYGFVVATLFGSIRSAYPYGLHIHTRVATMAYGFRTVWTNWIPHRMEFLTPLQPHRMESIRYGFHTAIFTHPMFSLSYGFHTVWISFAQPLHNDKTQEWLQCLWNSLRRFFFIVRNPHDSGYNAYGIPYDMDPYDLSNFLVLVRNPHDSGYNGVRNPYNVDSSLYGFLTPLQPRLYGFHTIRKKLDKYPVHTVWNPYTIVAVA